MLFVKFVFNFSFTKNPMRYKKIETQYAYFSQEEEMPSFLSDLINVFIKNESLISSSLPRSKNSLKSDEVLGLLREDLINLGYEVERDRSKEGRVIIPNVNLNREFFVDAWNNNFKVVLEVEAGRAYANNQFLKDLFESCIIPQVEYLVIAVKNVYSIKQYKSHDFKRISDFMTCLHASERKFIPLKGILIIGY